MCGRFTLTTTQPEVIQQAFTLDTAPQNLAARYNVAPSQTIPGVIQDTEGKNHLVAFYWGLIPFWAKEKSISSNLINARSETLHEKRSFRDAFKKRRCLVVADGFYEWRKNEDGTKTPMYIRIDDGALFGMAGIWERWTDPTTGEMLESCSIITTQPNDLMKTIHNRMPVILLREAYDQWLNPAVQEIEPLQPLLRPFDASRMMAYPVSTKVNRGAYDDPSLIEPLH
ncbi:MAG: SOS response-associated peptidase [Anaerolineae bacterium]|nr:SOS response-associated peptidase [Anaerolineae bacterium]